MLVTPDTPKPEIREFLRGTGFRRFASILDLQQPIPFYLLRDNRGRVKKRSIEHFETHYVEE